jgi:hypothetical protein
LEATTVSESSLFDAVLIGVALVIAQLVGFLLVAALL